MASNLSEILARVDELKAQIDALRPINPEQEARLMQKLRLEWNYHSNALEGNKLTLGETRAFLLQGLTAQGKPFRDYLDIKGYNEAILLLEEFVHQERPLTEAAIRELHKIILVEPYHVDAVTFDGTPTRRLIEPGKYKTTPNHVITSTGEVHYYASPEETPARMGDLVAWYRRELEKPDLHPLLLAATFHYEFAAIHPFDDGNGRMARLLMNLILMQTGFVPVVVQVDTKEEYLLALEKADAGELEEFIALIGRGLLRSMELYLRAARGERIEELGDFDKRVALLQRRLETQKVVTTLAKTTETQSNILNELIFPLGQRIHEFFGRLEAFFNLSIYHLEYKAATPFITTMRDTLYPHASFQGLINEARESISHDISEILLFYQLKDFVNDNSHHLRLTLFFKLHKYKIEAFYDITDGYEDPNGTWTLDDPQRLLLRGNYDALPSINDITSLIFQVGDELYQLVEYFADSSSHPQDPTAP